MHSSMARAYGQVFDQNSIHFNGLEIPSLSFTYLHHYSIFILGQQGSRFIVLFLDYGFDFFVSRCDGALEWHRSGQMASCTLEWK